MAEVAGATPPPCGACRKTQRRREKAAAAGTAAADAAIADGEGGPGAGAASAAAAGAAERDAAAATAATPRLPRHAAGVRITNVRQTLEDAGVFGFIGHFSETLDDVVGPSSDGKSRRLLTPITGGDLMLKLCIPRVRARASVRCARPWCLTRRLSLPDRGAWKSNNSRQRARGDRRSSDASQPRGRGCTKAPHSRKRLCCSASFRRCAQSTATSTPTRRRRGASSTARWTLLRAATSATWRPSTRIRALRWVAYPPGLVAPHPCSIERGMRRVSPPFC